ncbi:hypothetical protein AAG570_010653 [Ranatra chinensis]|uniref:Tubulin-specific chaperone D n=1 Tax=Ranatra chinensis TaxID=642074 RepID=A0ABD0YN78_9HEMI
MLSIEWKNQPYRLSRKFAVKIIQRIGLTFLKLRVITWRYQRGNRSLDSDVPNLCSGDSTKSREPSSSGSSNGVGEEEDDQDVPSEIEEVIEELMQALKDPDITIRWSAAKGIGRVMGRMNKYLGDEVIGCVLGLLNPRENDCAWHGGCLTLAELSKRGLLLPSRLSEVIPLVKKALVYDEPKGYASVGVHVRDAACYVCWTFARAYDSDIFKPYVNDIANALVIAACFDREISIRKAASAAFQEHIGRQGSFPHGIDIMTNADYFSVAVRSNAYLNISVFIAQYEEYTTSLIDHLIDKKIEHWDIVIRELSANALHNLTPKAPNYMLEFGLPTLFQKMNSIDANVRHGSIMAAGEVIHALSFIEGVTIDENIQTAVRDLIRFVKERQQFKGMSGELMKIACCHLIHKCSLSKLPFHGHEVINDWQNLIDECLCHEVGNIRNKAAIALSSLCSAYYDEDGVVVKEKVCSIVKQYTEKLKTNDETARIGHALALGSLSPLMLLGNMNVVINCLIDCATTSITTEKWVESRRTAIKALSSICTSVGISDDDRKESCKAYIPVIMECFIEGLKDYTTDDRGDTGAWVRESSMSGIQTVMQLAASCAPHLLTEDIVRRAFCGIVQQAVERIDRTRALAGTVFSSLLHNSPEIPNIPERERIVEIFTPEVCKTEINWLSLNTFPKFTEMISLHTFTYSLMTGLVISVGGLSESLVNASSASFFSYLRSQPIQELTRICDIIVEIYEKNLKNDRIVLPMLSFLERLISSGAIQPILDCPESTFAASVLRLTKNALNRCSEKFKLISSVDVYCQLIQVRGDVCRTALQRIMILLCHRFAWLRKVTATKFYEALMTYGDDMGSNEETLNEALAILSDTEWSDLSLEEVKPFRNKLSALFHIPIPKTINNPNV